MSARTEQQQADLEAFEAALGELYAVSMGQWSDYQVLAVFTKKDDADRYLELFGMKGEDGDPIFQETLRGR